MTSPKMSLFFYSLIQFILEFNGIISTDAKLVKAPRLIDSIVISLMHYYKDKNKMYYLLHINDRWIYEDKIFKSKKKKRASFTNEDDPSSAVLLSDDAKVYFDDWFGRLLDDNHVREDQIMDRVEVVAKDVEEGIEKIKEEIKVEVKASEVRVMAEVGISKGAIEYIHKSAFVFNIDLEVVAPTSDPSVVAPTRDPANGLP